MIVYIDEILLENVMMNYIILFATATICKTKMKYLRILLASLLGGIYAIMLYLSNSSIYSNVCMKFGLSICMVYVALKAENRKTFMKQLMIFYLTSFCFGGATYYLLYGINPQFASSNNRRLPRK